jgi:hypothetical protein
MSRRAFPHLPRIGVEGPREEALRGNPRPTRGASSRPAFLGRLLPRVNRRGGRFDRRMNKAGRPRGIRSCGESPSRTSCPRGRLFASGAGQSSRWRRSGSLTIGALRPFQVAAVDRAAAVVDHQPARSVLDAEPRLVRLRNRDGRPAIRAPHHSHNPNPRAADPQERGWLPSTQPRGPSREDTAAPTPVRLYSTGVTRTMGSRQWRGASGMSPSGAANSTSWAPHTMQR